MLLSARIFMMSRNEVANLLHQLIFLSRNSHMEVAVDSSVAFVTTPIPVDLYELNTETTKHYSHIIKAVKNG